MSNCYKTFSGEFFSMNEYTLGLNMGGLMEDPYRHIEHIETVTAPDLLSAKKIWAKKTGHLDEYWDDDSQTYWGWSVVEI